jgi:hypothetical protein
VEQNVGTSSMRPWAWLVGVTLVAALVVQAGRAVMPWEKMFPDFLCYWTAGRLVAEGRSPYDPEGQTRIQREYGWDRDVEGRGVLDFLPYYYPPWFAMACAAMVPLGFEAAKNAWFFLSAWLLLASGVLLKDAVPGLPRSIPVVLVPLFFLSFIALMLGQTSILFLCLVALAWRLLERGRDHAAGVVLAALTTKPQLAAVLLLVVLIWAVRRGRLGVVIGFFLTLAALSIAGALVVPSWPIRMLEAMRRNPPPTEYFPWIGASWLLVLRTLGLRSWALGAAYLALAAPLFVAAIGAALDRARSLRDTISLGLIAAFFVAPYARHYDFPVLLIPLLVLLGDRLAQRSGAALLLAVSLLPYLQFIVLVKYRYLYTKTDFFLESTYFWIPLLIATAWFATGARAAAPVPVPAGHPGGAGGTTGGRAQ